VATRDRFRATSVGRPWIAFVLGALALACSSTDSGMHFQFANEGTICLFAAGDQTSSPSSPFPQPMSVIYAAGDVASIAVQFPTCLAGSCTRAAMASCTV